MILDVECTDVSFLIKIIANVLKYLHFLIPILLIVLVIFDISKVVVSNADDKAKTEAFNKIVKRVIYAVIIFLLPTIIFFIFNKIDDLKPKDNNSTSSTTWYNCLMDEYRK